MSSFLKKMFGNEKPTVPLPADDDRAGDEYELANPPGFELPTATASQRLNKLRAYAVAFQTESIAASRAYSDGMAALGEARAALARQPLQNGEPVDPAGYARAKANVLAGERALKLRAGPTIPASAVGTHNRSCRWLYRYGKDAPAAPPLSKAASELQGAAAWEYLHGLRDERAIIAAAPPTLEYARREEHAKLDRLAARGRPVATVSVEDVLGGGHSRRSKMVGTTAVRWPTLDITSAAPVDAGAMVTVPNTLAILAAIHKDAMAAMVDQALAAAYATYGDGPTYDPADRRAKLAEIDGAIADAEYAVGLYAWHLLDRDDFATGLRYLDAIRPGPVLGLAQPVGQR